MSKNNAALFDSPLGGLRTSVRHQDLEFDLVKPFGPNLLEAQLPDQIVSQLLGATDQILADKERESWGAHLVGQIREEPRLAEEVMQAHGVLDYLKRLFAEYVISAMYADADQAYKQGVDELRASGRYRNPTRIEFESAWVISQLPGEYNPIHNHSQTHLASVIYLKVPEQIGTPVSDIPNKLPTDGYIEFVDRSGAGAEQLITCAARVRPRAGRIYIFPATLMHLVYPFRGEGERRSISINATYHLS